MTDDYYDGGPTDAEIAERFWQVAVEVRRDILAERGGAPWGMAEQWTMEDFGAECNHPGIPGERFGAATCCWCQSTFPPNRIERVDRRVFPNYGGPVVRVPLPPQRSAFDLISAAEPQEIQTREYAVIGHSADRKQVLAEARWIEETPHE